MVIVTAGKTYLDIDAFSSGVAYAFLLSSLGKKAIFASSAKPNNSVCPLIKDLGFDYEKDYKPTDEDEFVVVDVSNPDYIDSIARSEKIVEVIDHHTGYESFWENKPVSTQIEFIGSVATMIFEKFAQTNNLKLLSKNMCKLLYAGILDNTINLRSSITTERDKIAAETLQKLGDIEHEFSGNYFQSCQDVIENDLKNSILMDIKSNYKGSYLPSTISQLMIYDSKKLMQKVNEIKAILRECDKNWLMNLICIGAGKSYLIAENADVKADIERLFDQKFDGDILELPKFMLRKEIIKFAQQKGKIM